MIPTLEERYRGCLLGLACGDAVGTTVEFMPRGSFVPVKDMRGGGPFGLAPGQWTDDTSMALCLAESLLTKGGFDAHDQMARYLNWWQWGYLSSTGECFDIGMTVGRRCRAFRPTAILSPTSEIRSRRVKGPSCDWRRWRCSSIHLRRTCWNSRH